jgi:hypothetical protein
VYVHTFVTSTVNKGTGLFIPVNITVCSSQLVRTLKSSLHCLYLHFPILLYGVTLKERSALPYVTFNAVAKIVSNSWLRTANASVVFGKCWVRDSTRPPAILNEPFCGPSRRMSTAVSFLVLTNSPFINNPIFRPYVF